MTAHFQEKPYSDYKFLGVTSFSELLAEAGREFSIIEDQSLHALYEKSGTFLKMNEDTVTLGIVKKPDGDVYFLEFGIMIAPHVSARAFIVFIFDHCPVDEEMERTAADIESLVNARLDELQGETLLQQKSGHPGMSVN